MVPTRELAIQVAKNMKYFAKHLKIKVLSVYGGVPIHKQIRELTQGTQIVVGTPGRIIDLLERGRLIFDKYGCFGRSRQNARYGIH